MGAAAIAAAASAANGFGSLGGAIVGSQGALATGEYNARLMELNSKMAEFQAQDAISRGDKEAQLHLKKARALAGSQRVSLAAQGISVDSGTASDLQEETAVLGALDATMIRNNAWREAWGYRVQAQDSRNKAGLSDLAAKNDARSTLLTGGMKAIGHGIDAAYQFEK